MTQHPAPHGPPRYTPWSCALCDRCWLDLMPREDGTLQCIYGGPFVGFVEEDEISN